MTDVAQLKAIFTADDKDLTAGIAESKSAMSGFAQDTGAKLDVIGGKVSALGAGMVKFAAPVAGAFGAALVTFANFDNAMTNTLSLTNTAREDAGGLYDAILSRGSESIAGNQAVAESYYDIVSGVADATTHIAILDAAIATSEGGQANLSATTGALVGVMNAYGLEADQAAFVSDVMTNTVKNGVLTMDEMAAALPAVTSLASTTGVGFDELAGSIALITKTGTPASVAATQLRAGMTALLNPNETLKAAIAELGYESGEAMLAELGLAGSLEEISNTSTVADEGLAKTLGSTEALGAALTLTSDGADDFLTNFGGNLTDAQREMKLFIERTQGAEAAAEYVESLGIELEGVTAAAQEIQRSSPAAEFAIMKNQATSLMIEIGGALAPAMSELMAEMKPVIKSVTEWIRENPKLVKTVGLLAFGITAVGTVLIPVGMLISGIGSIVAIAGAAFGVLSVAFGFFASVIGGVVIPALIALAPILIPLIAIAAVFGALYATNFGGFADSVNATVDAFKNGDLAGIIGGITGALLAVPVGIVKELLGEEKVDEGLGTWSGIGEQIGIIKDNLDKLPGALVRVALSRGWLDPMIVTLADVSAGSADIGTKLTKAAIGSGLFSTAVTLIKTPSTMTELLTTSTDILNEFLNVPLAAADAKDALDLIKNPEGLVETAFTAAHLVDSMLGSDAAASVFTTALGTIGVPDPLTTIGNIFGTILGMSGQVFGFVVNIDWPDPPDWVSDMGVDVLSTIIGGISALAGQASGTSWTGSGSITGIAGFHHNQEAVVPHSGMMVTPSPSGLQLHGAGGGGGGGGMNINTLVINSSANDIRKLVDEIETEYNRRAR